MALLEIETTFVCNASRLGSKKHCTFAFTHPGNSKPTAVSLFQFVWPISEAIWNILTSDLAFLVHQDLVTLYCSLHVLGLGA